MIEHIMLARFSVAAENEHSCSGTVNPLTVYARPVCEARRGSHKGKVTVMFGSNPLQQTLSLQPKLLHDYTEQEGKVRLLPSSSPLQQPIRYFFLCVKKETILPLALSSSTSGSASVDNLGPLGDLSYVT